MGAQMFFSLLPSEISRLVLGYLAENGCYEACNTFFLECAHLSEIRGQFPSAYDITCRVGGISLMDLLHDYIRTVNLINEELEARSPTWTSSPSAACRPGQTSTCLKTFINRYCTVPSGIAISSPHSSSVPCSSSWAALMTTSQRPQPAPSSGISFHPAYRPQQSRIAMARHSGGGSSSIQSLPPVPSAAGTTSSASAIFVPLHPIITGNTRPIRARFQMAKIQTIQQNRCPLSSAATATTTCASVPLFRPVCPPPASNVFWSPTPSSASTTTTTVVTGSDPTSFENLSSHKRKRPITCRPLDAPSPGDQITVQKGFKIHTSPTKEVNFERIISNLMVNARTVADRINTSIDSIASTGPRQRTSMNADKSPSPQQAPAASLASPSPPMQQHTLTTCNDSNSNTASPGTNSILLASPNPEFEGLVEQLLKEMEQQNTANAEGHCDGDVGTERTPSAVPTTSSAPAADLVTSVNSAEGQLAGFQCPLSPDPVTGSTQCLSAPPVSIDEEEEKEAAATKPPGSELVQEASSKAMGSCSSVPAPSATPLTVQAALPRPTATTLPLLESISRSPHLPTSTEQQPISTAPPVSSTVPSYPTTITSACYEQSSELVQPSPSNFPTSCVGTCNLSSYPIVSSRVQLLTPPSRPADGKLLLTPDVAPRLPVSASFAPPPAVNLFPCSPQKTTTEIHPCFSQFKPDPDLTNLGFSGSTPFGGGFGASCGEDNDLSWFFDDVSASIRAAEAVPPKTGASSSFLKSEPQTSCLSEVSTLATATATITSASRATLPEQPVASSASSTVVSTVFSPPPANQQQQCQSCGLFDSSSSGGNSSLLTPTSAPLPPPPPPEAHSTDTTTTIIPANSSSTLLVSPSGWLRVVDLSALEVQPICLPTVTTPKPIAPKLPSEASRRQPLRCATNVAMSVLGAAPFIPKPLGENTVVLGQTETHSARSYPNLIVEPKKAPKYTSSRFLRAVEGGTAKRPSEEERSCRPSPDSTSICSPGSEKPTPAKIRKTKRKKVDLTQLDVAGILAKLH